MSALLVDAVPAEPRLHILCACCRRPVDRAEVTHTGGRTRWLIRCHGETEVLEEAWSERLESASGETVYLAIAFPD